MGTYVVHVPLLFRAVGEVAHLAELASASLLIVPAHRCLILKVQVLVRVSRLRVLHRTIVLTVFPVGFGRRDGVTGLLLFALFLCAFLVRGRGLWLRFARAATALSRRYLLLLHQVVDLAEWNRAFHVRLDVQCHQLRLRLDSLAT